MPRWWAADGCGCRRGEQAASRAPGRAGRPPAGSGRAGPLVGRSTSSRWWTGPARTPPAGTPPRPQYDVQRTSLHEREHAKAPELSPPGRPVAASTVKHRRQRWQAEGLPGLVDRRVIRRRSPAGRADPVIARAMDQAIAEATDDSSRTATFIIWRTRQILAERGRAARSRRGRRCSGCSRGCRRAATQPGPRSPAVAWRGGRSGCSPRLIPLRRAS